MSFTWGKLLLRFISSLDSPKASDNLIPLSDNNNNNQRSSSSSFLDSVWITLISSKGILSLISFSIEGRYALEKGLVKDQKGRKELAATIGKEIAKRLIEKGIKDVAFDKGGYKYHGLIKILADSAREEGLNF